MAQDTDYVCDVVSKMPTENGFYPCLEWIVYAPQSNFIIELSQLSYDQTYIILSYTAALFAAAWTMKHLSLTARKG